VGTSGLFRFHRHHASCSRPGINWIDTAAVYGLGHLKKLSRPCCATYRRIQVAGCEPVGAFLGRIHHVLLLVGYASQRRRPGSSCPCFENRGKFVSAFTLGSQGCLSTSPASSWPFSWNDLHPALASTTSVDRWKPRESMQPGRPVQCDRSDQLLQLFGDCCVDEAGDYSLACPTEPKESACAVNCRSKKH